MNPSLLDRRSFLTRSAAAIGGIAMASTVVDSMIGTVAGATVGVTSAKPKLGGTLNVGLIDDVPNYHTFNGSQGKMDDSGFCMANALYDPLFVMSANGRTALPMLALSATPNHNYTVWTIVLRKGVKFTNGAPFNADIVLANFHAAVNDPTVGLAVKPIIRSVTKVNEYAVKYNMVIPFSTFPTNLAEQQIGYMAHPSTFSSTFAGTPVGTGPFKISNWVLNSEAQFVKNTNYWRRDAQRRRLPYLDGVNFKIITDDTARIEALATGAVDMILSQDGPSIASLKNVKGTSFRTDEHDPRDPAVNCLILNTTGTMNQYFAWAGEFQSLAGIPGGLGYLEKGQAIPAVVQQKDYQGTLGAVNPGTLQWDTTRKPVLNDLSIRQACAMAINRTTYFNVIDAGVGSVSDGIYRKSSRYYKNPHYPAYNPAKAKSLVNAYKAKNGVSTVEFVCDIVASNATALKQFSFFQQQLANVGITVTSRPVQESDLINNVIFGQYDCATWTQFGACDPSENFVWFTSLPATLPLAKGGMGMTALPKNTYIAGAVNFAHQNDKIIAESMLEALAAPPGSAAQIAAWQRVNQQFSAVIPYLFLDSTVSAFAARSHVQNWAYATAGDGTTKCLNPDGGSIRFDQIWLS